MPLSSSSQLPKPLAARINSTLSHPSLFLIDPSTMATTPAGAQTPRTSVSSNVAPSRASVDSGTSSRSLHHTLSGTPVVTESSQASDRGSKKYRYYEYVGLNNAVDANGNWTPKATLRLIPPARNVFQRSVPQTMEAPLDVKIHAIQGARTTLESMVTGTNNLRSIITGKPILAHLRQYNVVKATYSRPNRRMIGGGQPTVSYSNILKTDMLASYSFAR